MLDRVGQQLGSYRLLRLLGRGGFAEVYLGEHIYLKSHAALKVLHAQLVDEEAQQFVREAQLLASLSHPHIVRILDFALQEGVPFLVMEYAPGGTLRSRHPKQTQLALDTIVVYVSQVAGALQYAHDRHLVHRDVKPENMLLGSRSDVLLSDFGLAMLAPHTQSASTQPLVPLAGTAPYLAPEQLQGKVEPASDQYALGVVVYEWITGKQPFCGSPIEVVMQHLSALPPSLREQVKGLSPAIEEVVLRALSKAPALRFASVDDFASALAHASHETASVKPTPRSPLGTQRDRKHPAPQPLSIHLLGAFELTSAGTPLTTIDWPRLQSLLAYLVLHASAPQSRTHLAFLFWPDSTESQAHTNLRHLVYRLRHALPDADAFLHAEKQTLQWQPDAPWTLDVADFERAVARAAQAEQQAEVRLALEQAVELFRGDLLPGCYEEWILSERERLRHLLLDALERLTLLLEQERDYPEAIRMAQRLLRHDPLHEATYRHLMRLYALTGDRATALRTYHACATILERELATEPELATREAYESLLRWKDSPPVRLATSTPMLIPAAPLVGRYQEWARLQEVWQGAVARGSHLVLLAGEAGIGKTRLAEELLDWVARQGMTTAVARCYPAEGELVYAPVATWLRAERLRIALVGLDDVWLTEVARFVPDLLMEKPGLPSPGPMTERWQRQRLFEALARAVLAARQPLLLMIDDLQWCDRETLEWLHFLLRFEAQARLLLLATVRPEELGEDHPLQSLLAALRPRGQLTEIQLEPLNAPDTVTLASHIAGQEVAPEAAPYLYRETEGNPLFVVETVRMLAGRTRGKEHASSEVQIAVHDSNLPPTVQAVIAARLEQLTPLARKVMGLAATIGRAFTFQVLAQASQDDEDTLVRGLDELWQRRIVREQGMGSLEAYDFSHDKLREVAYATVSAARRRQSHRQVAGALEVVYADRLDEVSGLVASHYDQAGEVERAVSHYQRAAKGARQVYANAEAIFSYQRALALLKGASSLQRSQDQWREVTMKVEESLGDVFVLIGQLEEARNAYLEALALVLTHDHIRQAQLHRKRAQTWKTQRRFAEGLQAYSMAEAALEGEEAERTQEWWQEWIEIQLERIENHYLQAQLHELTERVETTRPVVERYGTQVQRAAFFQSLCRMVIWRDRFVASEETVEYAQSSLAALLELKNETEIAWARFILGYAYLLHGDPDLAEELLRAAQVMGEQIGDLKLLSRCLTYLTILYRKYGNIEEARRLSSQALTITVEMQLPDYIAMAKANLAWIAWREENLSEAQANALAALELWRPLQVVNAFHWMALWPLIGVALTQDWLAEAVDYARQLLDQEQQALPRALNTLVEDTIRAWDSGEVDKVRSQLQQAVALSKEIGYL
jgi:serine/threonine protein kinase/tetratricopeptide (TPR) repeat protein